MQPRVILLFIQKYFDLLPERGRYHFTTLDRSVETIRKAGAEPLSRADRQPFQNQDGQARKIGKNR